MKKAHKQAIQHTFDTVACGYDHPAMGFFPQTAERMIAELVLEPSCHLLDVCAGTGEVSLRAAERLTNGRVTGIDLSSGMLEQASRKSEQRGLLNVEFLRMDMEALAFPDHQFDAATCSFGLFFIEDLEQGLRHIAAKVRPGGKIAISTFVADAFEPCASRFMALYETFGKETSTASWKRIASDAALRDLFAAAGINKVNIRHEPFGARITPEDWWAIVWNAGFRGFLQQLSAEELVTFREQHLAEIGTLCEGGSVWLNTGVLIATGEIET